MLRRVALLGRQFRTMSVSVSPLYIQRNSSRMSRSTSIPSTMRAAQIECMPSASNLRSLLSVHTAQGDVDVIQVKEVPVPKPGKGQVLYKLEYAGANFIDTYQRSGLYKLPMPYILGNESAGKVVALGEGVSEQSHGFKEGDTVLGYTAGGSFAEYVLASALRVVKVPQGVTSRQAATACVQGLTALTFVKEAHEVKKGEYILVQAAAGGLGLLLCQLCKHYGATVIGTTSTEEKAALAKKAGADHVILYGKPGVDVAEEIFKITGGEGIDRGVHAAFDGVGKDTFQTDLKAVRR